MPVMRDPQTGRRVEMADHEAGRIRTAIAIGWEEITPPVGARQMPVMQNPKTGELAEVGIHEQERLVKLKREGWVDVSGQPVTVGIEVDIEEKTPQRTGDPVLVVTETPIEATEEPAQEKPTPKRTRRKN